MTPGSPQAETPARLARLEAFLAEDSRNLELLADACDAALAAGLLDRALAHIDAAEQLAQDPSPWLWRRAHVCIARRELVQAGELLDRLRRLGEPNPAVDHDRAYVHFLQQKFEACLALLAPWLEDAAVQEPEALQVLWLRAMHAIGRVDEAWDWATTQADAGTLQNAACGIASLLAVDAGHFEAARSLAALAIADGSRQPEALVARATVALAERDDACAQRCLALALEQNPEDGRTWSTLGLASLQAQQLPLAQTQLERATALMPGHIGSWHALGWTRLLQQDKPGARKAFERALALDGSFAESHGALGLVLALEGEPAAAQRHLATAARLDASNVSGRFAQALLQGEAADPARLQALARRLLDRPGLFGRRLSEDAMDGVADRTR